MSDRNAQRAEPSERERTRLELADRIGYLMARYRLHTKKVQAAAPAGRPHARQPADGADSVPEPN